MSRLFENGAAEIRQIVRPQMKHLGRHAKRRIIFLVVVLSSVVAVGAAVNEYLSRSQVLSEQILAKAGQLREATYGSSFNSPQTGAILAGLKGLIKAYEENMVFAESPYPGEIVLGRTPAGARPCAAILTIAP